MIEYRDPGDEDDIEAHPRRHWPRILVGRTLCYYPRFWTHEPAATPAGHDPGDEEPRWQPLSDISRKRMERRLGAPARTVVRALFGD